MSESDLPSGRPADLPSGGVYWEIFRQARDAILVVSLAGEIREANPAACALIGYSREELIRLGADSLLPPPYAKDFPALLAGAEQSEGTLAEFPALRKDGSTLPVEASSSLVAIGGERAFLVIVRDASERRRAQDALRESEERYRMLVETCPDAVTMTDLEGNFLMANRQAAWIHGLESPEAFLALRKNAFDLIAPEDRKRAAENLWKTLEDGAVRSIRYRLLRADGSPLPAEINASVVRDAGGAPRGFIGIIRDVTERERAEGEIRRASRDIEEANARLRALNEELEAKNLAFERTHRRLEEIEAWMTESEKIRSLGTLAGGMAHEFNNILGGVQGCASFLQMHAALDAEAREYVELILDASRRAAELTRSLLGVVQKAKSEPRPFPINETVRELAQMIRLTFPRGILVETDLAADLPLALGTPAQIHQALLNLAVNARDAMPSGGRMVLRTAMAPERPGAGRSLAVSVIDEGHGIPAEIRGRIFEPFFTTKPPGKGTGLGLPLVKGIVEAHGGEIEVRSGPGRGSTFTILLPVAPVQEESTPPTATKTLERGAGRLLVIDDDAVNRMVLDRILSGSGYRVTAAADGREALDLLRRAPGGFDLVLLDLVMPGMSGEETFRRIREAHAGIPVVILSGTVDEGLPEELLREGARAFLPKPIDARHILDTVRAILRGNFPSRP